MAKIEILPEDLLEEESQKHWLKRIFTGKPINVPEVRTTLDEQSLGFVETGPETISFLVRCVREGRHVMLVGPRGTGKSFMAGRAVDEAIRTTEFGYVEKLEIQGDPNKPPSDYFDDSITFHVAGGHLQPATVLAPFFQFAVPLSPSGFKTDENDRIVLQKDGRQIDRLVIFWDEGNRSSPAVLNAMLSLLAEGVIRRDGRRYQFPPVSCLLTRNPDGYDAQSAKMPSPLIDRFSVQLYVYSPSIPTFVTIIAPAWLARYRTELYRELMMIFKGFKDDHDAIAACEPSVFTDCKDLLSHFVTEADKKEGEIAMSIQTLFDKATKLESGSSNQSGKARCGHYLYVLRRFSRIPAKDDDFTQVAGLLGLVVLGSWGDARDPKEKAGMQYLPLKSRQLLRALADSSNTVRLHMVRLGDLTRYGTSIRAFEDLMLAAVSDAVADTPEDKPKKGGAGGKVSLSPVKIDLELLEGKLGWYLNHRCETNFNPDREPDKARRKTISLLTIARDILIDRRKEMLSILKNSVS